ncbi:hypothetical protein KUD11_01805 [Roseovarius sp. LXJ103]|uniref:hypothetical protein n=1 Tax=Roseovarius carneus TaxID=2853164 RepID=UPI0011B1D95A|nr:hypothetical protein [Roseovarius carneus]MBZ8117375.1 hypothetical protein [Roseovarius carneus]
MILFHVLITYGPNNHSAFSQHPQYKAQMIAREGLLEKYPGKDSRVICDYARSVARLNDLPNLQQVLCEMRARGVGLIFVDDLARILRIAPISHRGQLMSELQSFAKHLISLKHGMLLSEFTGTQIRDLTLHAEKMKLPRAPTSPRDTSAAQHASAAARSRKAQLLNQKINNVRSAMASAGSKITLQAVADEANAIGLRTSVGGAWTRQAVKRALDGLDELAGGRESPSSVQPQSTRSKQDHGPNEGK